MGKYDELADSIVELIGGKDNVSFFTHCVTRLRFNLKDQSVVDLKQIKQLKGVIGAQWSNGQLQIIIGQTVGDAYKAVAERTGLGAQEGSTTGSVEEKKKFHPSMLLDAITGCLTPLIPVMITAGMLKVIILLGEMSGVLQTDSSSHLILSFVADSGFYFLPVFIGATAARKFGANMGLGMMMGATLLHPNFMQAIADGNALNLFGLPVYPASYASSIFPAILTIFVMSKVEKFFGKYSPAALRSLLQPLLTIIVMIPLSLVVLSPAGAIIGEYFAKVMTWLYETTGFLGIGVLTSILPFVIMTGMHLALNPGSFQMLATLGYDSIVMPTMVLSNLNQGAAALAVALKTKNKEVRSLAISSAITVIVGGVSEPVMFGINLKYKRPMIAAMIGSFCGGCVAGLFKAHAYAFASMGVFGFPAFIGEGSFSALYAILAGVAVGMIVTFVTGLFIIKTEELV